jgi:Na+/phosphate symporter
VTPGPRWWARGPRTGAAASSLATTAGKVGIAILSIATFVLALELMKAGARDASPLFRRLIEADDLADALGVGWLFAYVVLSGSPVAAASLTLLDGAVLTPQQALAMIAGSRLGASMVVVLLGFLWILRGRGTREGLATGLLAMVVTATIQLPALAIGLAALELDLVPPLRFQLPALDLLDTVYGPIVGAAEDRLPGSALFALGIVVVVASFNLFDRALPNVSVAGDELPDQVVFRPLVMFLAGFGVTALTMSVSVSIGLLVPLSARGLVRRENVVPYIMGCNVSTFIDTLIVALLVRTPDGFVVVLIEMVAVAFVSLAVIAFGFAAYQRYLDRIVDRALQTRRSLAVTMGILVTVPLLLVVL